jgi:hypothetical protein
MQVLDFETADTGILSARRARRTTVDPRPEPDAVAGRPPPTAAGAEPGSIQTVDSLSPFTEAKIRKLQNDDAMAAGMIAVILSLAFVVLLSLTIGVNIWMQSVSRY